MKKGFLMVALGIVILAVAGVFVATRPMPAEVTEDSSIIIIGCPPRPVRK